MTVEAGEKETRVRYPGMRYVTVDLPKVVEAIKKAGRDKVVLEMKYYDGLWHFDRALLAKRRWSYYVSIGGGTTYILGPDHLGEGEIKGLLHDHAWHVKLHKKNTERHFDGYLVTAEQMKHLVQKEYQGEPVKVKEVRAGGRKWYLLNFFVAREYQNFHYMMTEEEHTKYAKAA